MSKTHKTENSEKSTDKKTLHFNYDDFSLLEEEKRALVSQSSPGAKAVIFTIIIFVTIAIIWASFAPLDEITRAEGKVIPSRDTQIIQYFEGGIVEEIRIREGDIVVQGQVLLIMDNTKFGADHDERLAQLLATEGSIARLRAEIEKKPRIDFPKNLQNQAPEIIASETNLFKSRKTELQASVETYRNSYNYANRELNIIEPLVKKGIMSEIELLKLKRTVNELKGNIETAENEFIAKAHTELTVKEAEYNSLSASLLALKDRMVRTTIRSPVYGKITKINVNTIGSVIRSGDDIIEVLPLDDTLLIEAQVLPKDIAFIHPNQAAMIKFSAYDFSIFGGIKGTVEYISADTIRDEDAKHQEDDEYYKVLIKTQKNYLGDGKKDLPILPGMLVTVDILTGRKTIMDYLLKPFLKARQEALRER